jgi:hypothetical protein
LIHLAFLKVFAIAIGDTEGEGDTGFVSTHLCLVKKTFDLHFSLADAVGFVPMHLCPTGVTIPQQYGRFAL